MNNRLSLFQALFRSTEDQKFTASVLSPESLPYLSSVIFHSLFLLKSSEDVETVLKNLDLISKIFTEPNLVRKSNLILGAIFPGVLSALVETIKMRKSSKILARAFKLYIDLVVIFIVAEPAEERIKKSQKF